MKKVDACLRKWVYHYVNNLLSGTYLIESFFKWEGFMAKKALIAKAQRKPKFQVRGYSRCGLCGRPRAFLRQFGMCRICFREKALLGEIPGVTKSSW